MSKHLIRQGFIIDRYSRDTHGQTEITCWVVTDHGPARLLIQQERCVFFVETGQQDEAVRHLKAAAIPHETKTLPLSTFQHQPVTAFYFSTQDAFYRAQDIFRQRGITVLEGDIRLHERYLMERFSRGGVAFMGNPIPRQGFVEYRNVRLKPSDYQPTFKVVSLDIECSARGELYSIGLSGMASDVVLMIGERQPHSPDWIEWVADEPALLKAFEQAVVERDPDIIIGWNVVNFDCRLLLKRAEKYSLPLRIGRDHQPARWRERGKTRQGFITVPGRVVVDGIDALKTATYQFDSFSLEAVARQLLGKGKQTEDVDNRMSVITHDFLHNKVKLAEYNLQDCRLVEEIFEQTRLLEFLRLRSQLTGLELNRIGGSVAAFTNLYLPRLHRAGYIAPNLSEGEGLASPGGYVMNSKPGLYRNVLVLDFKSLYPSIIRTFKVDPMGLIEGLKHPETAIPGFRGASFSRTEHFLPDIITSLWRQRDEAKQDNDAARSQAIKILMNSFYGILGSGGCRFYDTRLASSITLRGHEIMQQTTRWIESEGYQVIYGDTDSTFVLVDESLSAKEANAIGHSIANTINQLWQQRLRDEFNLDCHLEIEFETLYLRFLMPTIRGAETGSKKRYAGMKYTTDGERLVFKGLETVRSDWTPLAKAFQTELFLHVFCDQPPEQLVRDYVRQTLSGERDEQLVYRKRLRRPLDHYVKNIPPQVRAARQADELNKKQGKPQKYQNRGWISYLMTVNGPEAVEYRQSPIDYQHYILKQLKPVADGVLPFVGLDFSMLADDQMGLF
ncbi:DNA polymerase II [Endozoicomonas gorgoniicola]|uniref:DNA polymerase n=1 Tax=Endozoicomonas gorgoniicola TaxID=1234144 RepID=A0ABT3MY69_9GAMM|nr:DNA polymerase II [Endozoicomonas gorgoniicola]MCW7553934.1 DNA polymerase II [Endozoicomonas gorgoniicola]